MVYTAVGQINPDILGSKPSLKSKEDEQKLVAYLGNKWNTRHMGIACSFDTQLNTTKFEVYELEYELKGPTKIGPGDAAAEGNAKLKSEDKPVSFKVSVLSTTEIPLANHAVVCDIHELLFQQAPTRDDKVSLAFYLMTMSPGGLVLTALKLLDRREKLFHIQSILTLDGPGIPPTIWISQFSGPRSPRSSAAAAVAQNQQNSLSWLVYVLRTHRNKITVLKLS